MEQIVSGETAIYGITWWTMTMIVAGIAQGKNRSGFNWFLLSWLLTPPFALTLLVVFFDKLPERSELPQNTNQQPYRWE